MEFYVYAYLKKDGITPYYIGKGKGPRAFAAHCGVSVPKDTTKIVMMETNLSEDAALKYEVMMIAKFGRKDLGLGPLINLTDGGEGISGHVMTDETKDKISRGNKRVFADLTRKKKILSAQKEGNLRIHGVPSQMHRSDFHERAKATMVKRHGVGNCSQIEEVKARKAAAQKAAALRPIVAQIKELNRKGKSRKIHLGLGWYRKSDEFLEGILRQLLSSVC